MSSVFIHETAEVSKEAVIGDGTKIWNQAQVREGAKIGNNCIISKNVYIDEQVQIGSGVKVQNNVTHPPTRGGGGRSASFRRSRCQRISVGSTAGSSC